MTGLPFACGEDASRRAGALQDRSDRASDDGSGDLFGRRVRESARFVLDCRNLCMKGGLHAMTGEVTKIDPQKGTGTMKAGDGDVRSPLPGSVSSERQRAHRGRARLRARQEGGRANRELRPGGRHLRHLDPGDRADLVETVCRAALEGIRGHGTGGESTRWLPDATSAAYVVLDELRGSGRKSRSGAGSRARSDAGGGRADLGLWSMAHRIMVWIIHGLQDAGVEPDVWKPGGLERREDCERVVPIARRDVGGIVLGGEADGQKMVRWPTVAASVPEFGSGAAAPGVRRAGRGRAPARLGRRRSGRVGIARTARP